MRKNIFLMFLVLFLVTTSLVFAKPADKNWVYLGDCDEGEVYVYYPTLSIKNNNTSNPTLYGLVRIDYSSEGLEKVLALFESQGISANELNDMKYADIAFTVDSKSNTYSFSEQVFRDRNEKIIMQAPNNKHTQATTIQKGSFEEQVITGLYAVQKNKLNGSSNASALTSKAGILGGNMGSAASTLTFAVLPIYWIIRQLRRTITRSLPKHLFLYAIALFYIVNVFIAYFYGMEIYRDYIGPKAIGITVVAAVFLTLNNALSGNSNKQEKQENK